MITDLFDPSPSTATSLLPQVKIAREQGGSGGGFGAALLDALVGASGTDPLTQALASVHVHLAPAPILSTCRLQFLPQGDFPTLTPGQSITVHLGFGDDPPAVLGAHDLPEMQVAMDPRDHRRVRQGLVDAQSGRHFGCGRAEPIGTAFEGSSIAVPEGAEDIPGLDASLR